METFTNVRLYSLEYKESKTYLVASAFVAGNLLLPQLLHYVPQGGMVWLPIYFFTLIGAYKYGWKAGLLTAVFSPVINSLVFGMPPVAVLPAILVKSTLLAVGAGLAARYYKKVSIPILLLVVLFYQVLGMAAEWILIGDFDVAVQDFRIGIPGMCMQVLGGYLMIRYLLNK